jgi:hypothetical protein
MTKGQHRGNARHAAAAWLLLLIFVVVVVVFVLLLWRKWLEVGTGYRVVWLVAAAVFAAAADCCVRTVVRGCGGGERRVWYAAVAVVGAMGWRRGFLRRLGSGWYWVAGC